jgi:hypothetical protein
MVLPKTIARCSFWSTLLVYRCRNISVPVVVGIRARTTQFTSGRTSRRRGFLAPHPPSGMLLSTGTDFASRFWAGVAVPGVAGGVKAGLTKPGRDWASFSEDERLRYDGTAEA